MGWKVKPGPDFRRISPSHPVAGQAGGHDFETILPVREKPPDDPGGFSSRPPPRGFRCPARAPAPPRWRRSHRHPGDQAGPIRPPRRKIGRALPRPEPGGGSEGGRLLEAEPHDRPSTRSRPNRRRDQTHPNRSRPTPEPRIEVPARRPPTPSPRSRPSRAAPTPDRPISPPPHHPSRMTPQAHSPKDPPIRTKFGGEAPKSDRRKPFGHQNLLAKTKQIHKSSNMARHE